ncbi:MAG: hypothetical protein MUF64_27730 [Polyangiaceae bacterium]|nr:hypothetical protein [Polyangiaceae bacterium]
MKGMPSPEEFREEALGLLTSERGREILGSAALRLEPGALTWEGSHGPVQGHRVLLGLEASALGELDQNPSLRDALESGLARALARRPGQSLAALVCRWELEPGGAAGPYRQGPSVPVNPGDPEALRRGLVAYLRQREQGEAADWAAGASIEALRRPPGRWRGVVNEAIRRLGGSAPHLDGAV